MMVPEKSLVVYRGRPALVTGFEGEKINIAVLGGESFKVREKDIELIHGGPCVSADLEAPPPSGNVREAWELLAGDASGEAAPDGDGVSLRELAELAYGDFTPRTAWAAWELLKEGVYFSGDVRSVKARPRAVVEEEEKKRGEKQREGEKRAAFLLKLKKLPPFREMSSGAAGGGGAGNTGEAKDSAGTPPEEKLSESERRFLQDVEALARGKSDKSRTMKELGKSETPEEAHRLLLASTAWTIWENPHPDRFGVSRDSARAALPPPPEEERLDLTGITAYAIDSPWSGDPDDAVSLENAGTDAARLWVHVADPAASVTPGSPADTEARDRGATLYLPEGPARMFGQDALPLFALGLGEVSPALSFRITLKPDLAIDEVEIFPSLVRVTRLSYAEADGLIAAGAQDARGKILSALMVLAERNIERRLNTGAVMIELPETHIAVNPDPAGAGNVAAGSITVEQIEAYRSASLVRECMLLAGEGAARWALQRNLPFPFVSQEAGELPAARLPGLAGAWQLRRCMRPRAISARPAVHWGLGLDEYTQVTSPLRRYMDLLCHQQIRSRLGAGAYKGQKPLEQEEIVFRAAAAEAAAVAVNRAEKASRAHWMAVYLSGKKDSVWDGVLVDKKGSRGTVIIPALGLETQAGLGGKEELNDTVRLALSSVKIPEGEARFVLAG